MRLRSVVVGLGALLNCTACGFKGPLYLPEQNGAVVTKGAPATPVAAPLSPSPQTPATQTKRNAAHAGGSTKPSPDSTPAPNP